MATDTAADRTVRAHLRLAWHIAGRYYAPGLEREDLVQEALIGLLAAGRDHDPEKGPFTPFAALCMERRILAAVKSATRRKHALLSDAARTGVTDDGYPVDATDTLVDRLADVEAIAASRETLRQFAAVIASGLSGPEAEAVRRVVNGLGCTEKRLDNALQRARVKLRDAA